MHSLLKQQLKQIFGSELPDTGEWKEFIGLVNESYEKLQNDKINLEKKLELSSKEFKELNNFKNAIDSTAIVSLTDLKGIIIYANENFCKISGYSQNELHGKNHNIINSGYHPKSFWKEMWRAAGNGETWKAEICNRNKKGELYWVDSTVIPFVNDDGKVYQYLSIRFDITQRKKIEEEVKKNEEKFRLLIESATDIFYYTDKEGNFTYVNDIATQITGFSNEELLSMCYLDLVEPSQREKVETFYRRQSLLGNKVTYNEFPITTKSGKIAWIGQNVQLIHDKGEIGGIQAIARDITTLKNAQLEIENSRNFLNEIIDSIPSPLFVKNRKHQWVLVNSAYSTLTNIPKAKIIGKIEREFLPGREAEMFIELDEKQFKDKSETMREVTFKGLDENEKNLLVKKSYFVNQGNEFIICVVTDITERIKAEAANKHMKVFYENVLNKIPSDVVVLDHEQRYLFVNEIAVKDLEKRSWMIGHNDYEYCEHFGRPVSIAEKRGKIFRKVIETKEQLEFEEQLKKPDGELSWMLRRFYPVLDENNEIMTIIGFGIDITKRKEAEVKIQESEERLSLAISSANLGIWDWNITENKLLWDRSMYTIFNVNPQNFSSDYEAFEKTLHPEDAERVNTGIAEALKQGANFKDIFRIIDQNGSIKYISAYSKTFRDAEQVPYRMIGVNSDVTEDRLIEQRILKQQSDLEEAQHIARVGGWEIDVKTRTIVWSKEMYNICELSPEVKPTLNETYGMYTTETREGISHAFLNAIVNHEPFEMEAQILTQKNKIIDVRTKGVPFVEKGKVVAIRGIFQDISQEKEAKRRMENYTRELEKKNIELDQFAYVVSHDLKAPLRGINNLSMWIEEDLEGKIEKDTQTNLDLMRKRVKRMEGLIDGILQYSRAGRIKHETESFSLKTTIDELIESLSPPAHFNFIVPDNLPELVTEKIAIEQIFSNYISNAIKYNNNPEPKIEIGYKRNENVYEFYVADNGPGIEKEFFDKVFVIFQTLQARDTFESTGVGLAIVKKIVEDKGGKVWIESEMGKGTKFYFSWLINEED